jgi:FKBP-type peptidyl-prolyl cis-trans isomerase FklB
MSKGGAMKPSALAILSLGLLCSNVFASDDSSAGLNNPLQPPPIRNKMTGEAFLAANKNKPDVVTLPDGLQYKILVNGNGKQPTDNDVVTVNYSGKLIDGTEFDSSYKRGQPISFPVRGVIRGWVEALQLMKVGSSWEVYIPPALAYGERGAPPAIGPNETLIFKIDLIDIKKS